MEPRQKGSLLGDEDGLARFKAFLESCERETVLRDLALGDFKELTERSLRPTDFIEVRSAVGSLLDFIECAYGISPEAVDLPGLQDLQVTRFDYHHVTVGEVLGVWETLMRYNRDPMALIGTAADADAEPVLAEAS